MCGFVALLDLRGGLDSEERLQRMLATIAHRGPDDSGTLFEGPVALGFRRLSILDLSPAGHQPMDSADGLQTLVFNGEIYNFLELRSELEALGHRFRSQGDTEVLLAAYRQWGTDCLRRFNGMWAFVLYDRARRVLFGSRDRFGIKPLYRHHDRRGVVVASEIKAIRASGLYTDRISLDACAAFLHDKLLDHTSGTFFEGIEQLPPGHAFEVSLDGVYRQWPFYSVGCAAAAAPADAEAAFAELFEDAMRVHMRSDVPVGVNLSGGLDSTSILCAAARINAAAGSGEPLLAFCYQDPRFDESRYIADTLAQTGARIVPLRMTPEQLWDSMPKVLSFQDEPVHSMTALVGFHLMRLAADRGVKVVLNGQGADEVIGGYGNYFGDRWAELVGRGRFAQARAEIAAYTEAHGGDARERFGRALRHAMQTMLGRWAPYRRLADRKRRSEAAARDWLLPDLAAHLPPPPRLPLGLHHSLVDSVVRDPLPLYLRIEDRNAMAHSVEARLPFLDHRLVDLVFALGPQWKVRGPWNKFVLREGMRGRIPESVRSRLDKMGFPTDVESWFRGPLYERVRDVLHDPEFRRHPLFDAQALQQCLEANRRGSAPVRRVFAAVQLFLWQRQLGVSVGTPSNQEAGRQASATVALSPHSMQ